MIAQVAQPHLRVSGNSAVSKEFFQRRRICVDITENITSSSALKRLLAWLLHVCANELAYGVHTIDVYRITGDGSYTMGIFENCVNACDIAAGWNNRLLRNDITYPSPSRVVASHLPTRTSHMYAMHCCMSDAKISPEYDDTLPVDIKAESREHSVARELISK